MNELLDWLLDQKGGMHTYITFQQKILALRSQAPENAALARLLADLAGRFIDVYDGEPLEFDVASEALSRLTYYMKQATALQAGTASQQLALLNEIGVAELM